MRRLFTLMMFASLAGATAMVHAQTGPAPAIAVATGGAAAPHVLVMRQPGWLPEASIDVRPQWVDGTAIDSDFAIVPAKVALERRRTGSPIKAVYVVSRAADEYQVLTVSERMLADSPLVVETIVGRFEQARRWIAAHPAETAALIARATGVSDVQARSALGGQDFQVARPGPALMQALRNGGASGASHIDDLIADGPVRAAIRKIEQSPLQAQVLLSQR